MEFKFSDSVSSFFNHYLQQQRGLSKDTISTYAYSIQMFIKYLAVLGIKEKHISFSDITKKRVRDYLDWLEIEKGQSIQTRNLRLSVLHTFCNYVLEEDISQYGWCVEIMNIPFKKRTKSKIEYLKYEDMKTLLATPNLKKKKELRDFTIMALLYDSACRISEFTNIKTKDISIDSNCLTVVGKGNKSRHIPISKQVVAILSNYIIYYKRDADEYLFSNVRNERLSRPGITFIINKYVKICRNENSSFHTGNITPHIFRHSKASHLLESGVNIYYIRDFLGHESVQTTEIYARNNPEDLRNALDKHAKQLTIDDGEIETPADNEISAILSRFK